ncbi:hypothetical protein AAG906_005330 [Vitis piasezkii]
MGTKENKVGGGTIILECGPNYLVVVDVPYDASAPLPIPIPGQTTTVGAAIGYQVLWPAHLVSIHTPVLCPRQPGSVECGYYVMRYMKEIIANPNQLASKFDGRKSFSEMEINEVRSDWIMLMTQLIITHA